MRIVSEKCRRALSAILAAAMVLTSAPGTTMTAMAAEQAAASAPGTAMSEMAAEQAADGSEEAAADDTAVPEEGGKTALEAPTMQELRSPEFTRNPSSGQVKNGGEASFTLTVPDNSEVRYVIGEPDQDVSSVKDPTTDGTVYKSGESVTVPAPESEAETTVVVKAVAVPAENVSGFSISGVASAAFTFAAKQTEEPEEPVVVAAPTIFFKSGQNTLEKGTSVPFETEVSLELNTRDTGAVIYYTKDGTEPSVESAVYEEPVSLKPENEAGETVTVKAIAVADGRSSEVAEASIVFAAKAPAEAPAAPAITLKNGDAVLESGATVAYGTKVSMELEAQENAAIYYTVDGTNPTTDSLGYNEAVVLSSGKEDGETITVKAVAVADGKTSEAAEASVTFEASVRTVKIDFSGDRNQFTCKLVSEDSDQSAHWEDDSIAADQNSKLHLEIAAQTGFELKSVLLGTEEQKIVNGKADFRFTATEDTTITVNVEEGLEYVVYEGEGGQEIKPKENAAGTYVISPRAEYRIVGYQGTEAVVLAAADLTDVKGKHYAEIDSSVTRTEDNKAAVLSVGLDLAGTTCRVVLKQGEQEEVLTFEVKPVLKKVTVEGVKGGMLTQAMGEKKYYAMTLDPVDSEDDLLVECSDKQYDTLCSFIQGDRIRLYIRTANKTEDLTVTIYNLSTLNYLGDTQENRRKAVLCEFTLRIAAPAWTAKALMVKAADSTDTELKLSVTAPAGVKSDGKDYYVFEVKDPSTVSGNLSAQPRYFVERAETGTKTYTLKVIDAEAGKGTKKEFQVKAYLVRMDDAKAPVDLKDPGIVAQTEEPKAVKCFTKNPCYADRISLKKGTTAVYSGQQNVQIATINFGKNTSYVDHATAELVQKDNQRRKVLGYDIQARVVDGRVYADIGENTIPGKYTIRVKADAPTGAKPAEACIVITVAAGLHDIILESESESIYKAAGKAARAKATIGYDWYNQTFKPKNLKISYAVGSLDSAGSFTEDKNVLLDARQKPAVTVKNGSITISKDYQVKENPDENRFAVRVTVKSSIGVEKSAAEEFCVSADGQEFEKLIIIRPQLATYDLVLDADQKTYEASGLQGARVLVVRKGAQPGTDGKYAVDDLLLPGEGQYTLTVKGKGVTVDDSNNITVKDCTAKGISFTAQAKDGSGNKVSLKIDQLKYDEYDKSEVCVAFGSELGGWTELSSESGNNLSVLENRLQLGSGDWYYLRVMTKDEQGNLHEGDRFMNYSLAVSGGARILTDMGEGSTWHARNQWVRVQITGENATVTLKKGKTKVASYTMISEICGKEIKAPVITLAKGQKDLVVGKSGQSLVFDVKDSGCDSRLPEYAIFDPKACDAKSADFFGLCGDRAKGVALNTGKTKYDPQTGKLTIPVGDVFAAGSGTLYLSIFYGNDDGSITHLKLTKGIRIKAVDLKESFSMTKKYTISMMDARSVALQYKGNGVQDVKIEELYSENSKGTISPFWKTFDIGNDERSLQLRPGREDMAGQSINGYIKVSVSYENGNIKEYESKVTVSVLPWGKTANKYTASIAKLKSNTITAEDAQNMAVTISAGRNKTVPGVREVAGSVYDADGKETAITAHLTEDGKVALDLTGYIDQNKERGKTQKVIVKVLFDSAYRPKVEAYVPLQVTVSVPKNMSYKE